MWVSIRRRTLALLLSSSVRARQRPAPRRRLDDVAFADQAVFAWLQVQLDEMQQEFDSKMAEIDSGLIEIRTNLAESRRNLEVMKASFVKIEE